MRQKEVIEIISLFLPKIKIIFLPHSRHSGCQHVPDHRYFGAGVLK